MKNKHTIEWNNKAKTVHLKRLINDTQISDKINRGKKKEREKNTHMEWNRKPAIAEEDNIRILNTILLFLINLKIEYIGKFLGKYKLCIKNWHTTKK